MRTETRLSLIHLCQMFTVDMMDQSSFIAPLLVCYSNCTRPEFFATVWLGDPQCGMEIEQCQMRINRLFSGWKARTHSLQGILAARIGCNRMREHRRHQFLLLEATRRLLEKTNHDCVGQVDYILQASFPLV
ncbi:hypothetical protein ASPFODRAFT_470543 [Aspergillus luchuensis CBS 106.47]|uniref:Uncharacterized protein n=1 Tax=Aspergillus luchuensis (strain CBS 106.47) TaxID=1137211 RepID=A0A1M3SZS5_ASPLC|nr:hypothetical protein ASPFODRAFT_470543 [Aspergillus luchuensis CBS 106.47]